MGPPKGVLLFPDSLPDEHFLQGGLHPHCAACSAAVMRTRSSLPGTLNNDFTRILGDRFGCSKMAPAPPNNDFTPILADRCGCLKTVPAPPQRTTLPQSWLTGLVASKWRQLSNNDFTAILAERFGCFKRAPALPTTILPQSWLTGLAAPK